jgi:hypothetical protein
MFSGNLLIKPRGDREGKGTIELVWEESWGEGLKWDIGIHSKLACLDLCYCTSDENDQIRSRRPDRQK